MGCGQRVEPAGLLRFVVGPDGELAVDLAARSFGRGIWAHPRPECLQRAASGGLARAARRPLRIEPQRLTQLVADAADRRCRGLLMGARGAGALVLGREAVVEVGSALQLVVLANDALDVARDPRIAELAAAGRGIIWGRKTEFGALFGRQTVAVFGLRDAGIAKAVVHAIGLARLAANKSDGRDRSSEV